MEAHSVIRYTGFTCYVSGTRGVQRAEHGPGILTIVTENDWGGPGPMPLYREVVAALDGLTKFALWLGIPDGFLLDYSQLE